MRRFCRPPWDRADVPLSPSAVTFPRAKLYYLRELTGKSARLKEVFAPRVDKAAKQ